jgi:hypothetical protein
MERNNKDKILLSITSMSLKSMTSRPKKKEKLYKESIKQKVSSLKRLITLTNS